MPYPIKISIMYLILFIGVLLSMPLATPPGVPAHIAMPKIDMTQITCMAKNIFYEAAGEPIIGQAAVARVVLNRVNHGFAKTPCNVIYQATTVEKEIDGAPETVRVCQFSWVCADRPDPNKNSPDYVLAKQVAYDVMVNDAYKEVVPKTTLFFHNLSITPQWSYAMAKQIGNHIFYSKGKQ